MFEVSGREMRVSGLADKSAQGKSRLVWVDYAKVFGIYLVVFGHLPLRDNGLNQYLTTFRMPLFFMLSGYFETSGSVRNTAATGFKRLLWPYAVFYFLAYAWTLIETFLLHIPYYPNPTSYEVLVKPLFGFILGIGDNTQYSTIINGPLWFLMALFWVKLFFSLLSALSRGKPLFIYLAQVVVVLAAWLLRDCEYALWFSIECALLATPFYVMGYFIKRHDLIEKLKSSGKMVFGIPIAFSLSLLLYRINGGISIANGVYGKNILLFYLAGACGSLMLILFTRSLPQRRVGLIEAVAQGTLVIVGLHLHLAYGLADILEKALNAPSLAFSNLQGLAFALVITAALIVPIKAIEKKCPWVLGRFKGKRERI
jgi:acyltransferase